MSATSSTPPAGKPMVRAQGIPASQPVPAQAQAAAPAEGVPEEAGAPSGNFLMFKAVPAWMVSAVVHFITIVILALLTIEPQVLSTMVQISAPPEEKVEEV